MTEAQQTPLPPWWPLLVWGGDLHVLPSGKGVDRLQEEIQHAQLSRFDALIVPALREGAPLFESPACRDRGRLRRASWEKRFRRRRNPPFEEAVRLACDAGIRVWAQMDVVVGGSLDFAGPSLGRSRPRWTVRNAQGRSTPIGDDHEHLFLCPSNPEVVRLLCDVSVELANRYPFSALVLDFRRLPHEQPDGQGANCLCFQCQSQAEKDLGLDLQEVLDEGTPEIWREWQEWRNETWRHLVRRIRTQVWACRPGMPVLIRATPNRPAAENPEAAPPSRFGPAWDDWLRNGLAEMVLLDQGTGSQAEAERALIESLPTEDLDSLILPLFHESPSIARPEHWTRPARLSLPGWGLTQHLAEAWSSAILLKPGPRHEEARARAALEIDPLAACLDALETAETLLRDTHLGLDIRAICQTLATRGRELDLEGLEGLIFQLATLVTMLDQERETDLDAEAVPRGWVELARRLLRWHANLHCSELYLFNAG